MRTLSVIYIPAFHKAGQQHKAVEVLEQLTHNAVVENRLDYLFILRKSKSSFIHLIEWEGRK